METSIFRRIYKLSPLSAYEYLLQRDECMKFMLGISTNYVVRYMCRLGTRRIHVTQTQRLAWYNLPKRTEAQRVSSDPELRLLGLRADG